jgi:hypothetical protein
MKSRKLVVLALIMMAAFTDGVAHQLTAPGEAFGPSDIVFIVLAPLLVFAWYRFDSDELAYRRTPFLNVAIVALAVLALPYYFFRSRGFARGSVAVCLFMVCCFGYVVLQNAGEYAAYYVWQS